MLCLFYFRLTTFKRSLNNAFRENRAQNLSLKSITEFINKDNASPFTQGEIKAAINKMTEDNQVMLDGDDMVYLV